VPAVQNDHDATPATRPSLQAGRWIITLGMACCAAAVVVVLVVALFTSP
jgi:hypothetical protein